MKLELPDGRAVELAAFHLVETYSGLLEGSLERATELYRRRGLKEKIRQAHGLCPDLVLDPQGPFLPPVTCVAVLKSFGHQGPGVWYSELTLAWFVEGFEGDTRQIVNAGIKGLDWSAHARPVRFDDV